MNKKPAAEKAILRDVIPEDLPVFFQQQLDPEAVQMADFPSRDEQAFMAHWRKILTNDEVIAKTIVYDGQVAGNIGSFVVDGKREVGYWLGKDFWGRGIATSALAEFLKFVTQRPLYAEVAIHNRGSQRVLEKCGFERIAGNQAAPDAESQVVDIFVYMLK